MRRSALNALQLVEPDDEAYAALSGKFTAYNAAHSTWDWKSYSIVLVEEGSIREFSRFQYPDGPERIDLQKEL